MPLHAPLLRLCGYGAGKKAVILMLDDVFDEKHSSENIAWLYDADFEF